MSPAATATPGTAVPDRHMVSVDRRQYASDLATCGSIAPSDQSILGPSHSIAGCLGGFCAVSSPWVDCLTPGWTYRTTCLDKHATCVGFACPSHAVLCTLYTSTFCQTWYYGTSLTAYGCGTASLTINVIPLSLTSFTPISVSSTFTSLSLQASPTSSLSVQTNSITTQSTVSNIPLATTFSASSSPPKKPASLSTGAQAGIGIGAPTVAVILFAVLFIFFRKKHKANLRQSEEEIQETSNNQKSTSSKLSPNAHEYPAELTALATVPHQRRSELSDYREVAHELPAT